MKQLLKTKKVLLVIVCTGFTFYGNTQIHLPDTWQTGTAIVIDHGPGMYPESSKLMISDTACFEIREVHNKISRTTYRLSQTDLNTIMAILKTNNFDKIKLDMTRGFAYDKPTKTISLVWDNKNYNVTTSCFADVNASDRTNLQLIYDGIYKILYSRVISKTYFTN